MKQVEAGMVLFYYGAPNFFDDMIDLGERIEDGPAKRYYYHLAVAVSERDKIEAASSGVQELPTNYSEQFDVLVPPVDPARKAAALERLRSFIGQRYDWWMIIDDGLRILSKWIFGKPLVHLPVGFVQSQERHEKICVSLLRKYLTWAGSDVRIPFYATVQDAYNLLIAAGSEVQA